MNRILIAMCALSVLVPARADAQSAPLVNSPMTTSILDHSDGSVTVDGNHFDTITDFWLSDQFRAGGYRCATRRLPQPIVMPSGPSDCTNFSTTIDPAYDPANGDTLVVPVVFHVMMSSSGDGDVSDTLLQSQIDILNEDYNAIAGTPGEPGTTGKIQFALATVDPDGNPHSGISRHTDDSGFNDSGDFKSSVVWNTHRYLNIYTNNTTALGYAFLPPDGAGETFDGVVLTYRAVGRGSSLELYDQGRTATHEVGHYLGLQHTFGSHGDCDNTYTGGDLITDTNPEEHEHYDCIETNQCGVPAPIHNYMEYTNDTCMYEFTPEQVNRIRCSIMNYRAELVSWFDVNRSPNASFTMASSGYDVAFTDTSTDTDGAIASWAWDFGDGATSSEQSPTHTFAGEGKYNVSLTVTDDDGATGNTSQEVIINTAPHAEFSWDGPDFTVAFADLSSDPGGQIVSWAWDFGDGSSSTEQNPSHTYTAEQTFTVTLTVTDDLGGSDSQSYDLEASENGTSGGDGDGGGCGCRASGGTGGGFLLVAFAVVLLTGRRRRRTA